VLWAEDEPVEADPLCLCNRGSVGGGVATETVSLTADEATSGEGPLSPES
jgi:hypothetical protein